MYTLKIVERVMPESEPEDTNIRSKPYLRESYYDMSKNTDVIFYEPNQEGIIAVVMDTEQKVYIYEDTSAYLMNENAVTVRIIHRVQFN